MNTIIINYLGFENITQFNSDDGLSLKEIETEIKQKVQEINFVISKIKLN